MTGPRVFVVQRHTRRDRDTGEFVPRFPGLEAAARAHGIVVYVLGPRATPHRAPEALADLTRGLRTFRGDLDYLLLVGNPNLIAWAVLAAAVHGGGRVRTLQWSDRDGAYHVVDADLRGVLSGSDALG